VADKIFLLTYLLSYLNTHYAAMLQLQHQAT